jgi:alpha-N-arabinofuranosidase
MYGFNSSPETLTLSTSYYVQQMFSSNKGNTVLPVNSTTDFGPLYWVATKTDSNYYMKLANYGPDEQNVTVSIPKTDSGRLEMLSGPQNDGNQPYNVTVLPVTTKLKGDHGNFSITMPPWAVAVLAAT